MIPYRERENAAPHRNLIPYRERETVS